MRIKPTDPLAFLSVQQPWAWLIGGPPAEIRRVMGRKPKTIETRSRFNKHRGPLVICASKLPRLPWPGHVPFDPEDRFLFGGTVCVTNMIDCRPLVPDDCDAAGFAELTKTQCEDRWAWVFDDTRPIEALPIRGKQYLWHEVRPDIAEAIAKVTP